MTSPRGDEQASAVLELALVAPVVGLLVAGVVGMTAVVTDQLAAERTARAIARSVAVTGHAGAAAVRVPPDATVRQERGPLSVTVEVVVRGEVVGVPYTVSAAAASPLEPGVG